MLNNIYLKTIFDKSKAMFWWITGALGVILMYASLFPTMAKNGEDFNKMMEALPKELASFMMGGEIDIASPAGYFNSELFLITGPIIFLIFGIILTISLINKEEQSGSLDILLTKPVSRSRILFEKYAALVTLIFALGLLYAFFLTLSTILFNINLSADKIFAGFIHMSLFTLLFSSIAFFFTSLKNSSGFAISMTVILAFGTYLLKGFATLIDWIKPYRILSPFYYLEKADALRNGFSIELIVGFLLISLGLFILSLMFFHKRDIAV